jgi:hypothetical protein
MEGRKEKLSPNFIIKFVSIRGFPKIPSNEFVHLLFLFRVSAEFTKVAQNPSLRV